MILKSFLIFEFKVLNDNVFPSVLGAYLLNVMWSDRQVKGCPLKVNVTAACDAQKVMCSGDGLRGGTVGKEIKSFIDTRKAGPGLYFSLVLRN